MLQYKEVVPTFTCEQWEGDNFVTFDQYFTSVSQYARELYISEWRQAEKVWHDHKVAVGQWVVVNDISKKIEIVNDDEFRRRFELTD